MLAWTYYQGWVFYCIASQFTYRKPPSGRLGLLFWGSLYLHVLKLEVNPPYTQQSPDWGPPGEKYW